MGGLVTLIIILVLVLWVFLSGLYVVPQQRAYIIKGQWCRHPCESSFCRPDCHQDQPQSQSTHGQGRNQNLG